MQYHGLTACNMSRYTAESSAAEGDPDRGRYRLVLHNRHASPQRISFKYLHTYMKSNVMSCQCNVIIFNVKLSTTVHWRLLAPMEYHIESCGIVGCNIKLLYWIVFHWMVAVSIIRVGKNHDFFYPKIIIISIFCLQI